MNKFHAALITGLLLTAGFAQAALPTATIGAAATTSVSANPDVKLPNASGAAVAKVNAGTTAAKGEASAVKTDAKSEIKKQHHVKADVKAHGVDAKAAVK